MGKGVSIRSRDSSVFNRSLGHRRTHLSVPQPLSDKKPACSRLRGEPQELYEEAGDLKVAELWTRKDGGRSRIVKIISRPARRWD